MNHREIRDSLNISVFNRQIAKTEYLYAGRNIRDRRHRKDHFPHLVLQHDLKSRGLTELQIGLPISNILSDSSGKISNQKGPTVSGEPSFNVADLLSLYPTNNDLAFDLWFEAALELSHPSSRIRVNVSGRQRPSVPDDFVGGVHHHAHRAKTKAFRRSSCRTPRVIAVCISG
jgi:hypothetical protein